MMVLFESLIDLLEAAGTASPPGGGITWPLLGGIRTGHISDSADPVNPNPEMPAIRLMQQGGDSPLPIGGAENPLVLITTWSRKSGDEAIMLYEWLSRRLNQRHMDITTFMGDRGRCLMFVRQWKAWPLFDDFQHAWYVNARYYAKAFDFADLHAAFSYGP